MSFFLKLWNGEFGLVKSFWLFFFLVGLANASIISFIGSVNQDTYLENLYFITFLYSASSAYSIISLVGVWRSANLFDGNKTWVILAKIIVLINFLWLILFASIIIFSGIQYLLIYFCVQALIIVILNSRSGEQKKPAAKTNPTSPIPDHSEDLLWTEIAEEFRSSNKQSGLWAKCLVEASGDPSKAEFLYIKKRYEQLSSNTISKKAYPHAVVSTNGEVTRNFNVNIDSFGDLYKITPIQKKPNFNYENLSFPKLMKEGMFEIVKYKNRTLFHLHNGSYALIDANLVKVFDNEKNIKRAIDSKSTHKKFQQGFIVSFEKDVFMNI